MTAFVERLRGAGLRVASDEIVLRPGDVLVHSLEEAIRNSVHGLLVFSPASIDDGWTKQGYAALMQRSIETGQRFIPVLFGAAELPEFAANRRYCDFRGVDGHEYQRLVAALVSAIRDERPERPASPRPVPGSGVRPEGPRRFVLQVAVDRVAFGHEGGVAIEHEPSVAGTRLDDLVWRLDNARRSPARAVRSAGSEGGTEGLLTECGRELGRLFLSGPAGEALACET
ncbi:toll/interleukin-1 receptor domain-containing protein [Streptomyces luteolifulvus]|uniref:toll/interleukin-1 receptor domain-containing protein n=1 Tax=Streptomyces luteolifulvus TaxID=2615112 RepID=UPI001E630C0A|nr:toll/interleukin-1 receptor domain-containing protein [Streptomyces luteolifulvus]